jgi:hypothetical protein
VQELEQRLVGRCTRAEPLDQAAAQRAIGARAEPVRRGGRFEVGDPSVVVLEPAEARREPAQREPLACVDPALELDALAAREPGCPRDSRSQSSASPSFSQ